VSEKSFVSLVSPVDGSELVKIDDKLIDKNKNEFPIINNIPRFVGSDNYAKSFGMQWNTYKKTQLDSYTGVPISEDRLLRCFRGKLQNVKNKLVLEAGSGAGRFTEILLKYSATVHSFDYSNAVEANYENNGHSEQLTLLQADIRKMPFKTNAYDYVVCIGVLQHTPNPEESIKYLWKMVKPDGLLVIDHYLWRWMYLTGFRGFFTYRLVIKNLKFPLQKKVTDKIVNIFFPIHWKFRNCKWIQILLRRISPVHFYYPTFPLKNKKMFYEWAKLDTHDACTDYYKHYRTKKQLEKVLRKIGAIDIDVSYGGNGLEAICRKPKVSNL
jgi:SAM-dependent methyltransferase